MKHDSDQHRRRSIRLPDYDYAQAGGYVVTICAHDRACLFGEIVDAEMHLNALGQIVEACWRQIPHHFPQTVLDAFVVMPNHVHGIIMIVDDPVGARHASPWTTHISPRATHASRPLPARPAGPVRGSLGAIVGAFKSAAAKRINLLRATPGAPVWQRNTYEHIIRDDRSLDRHRRYVLDNPARWAWDRENPARIRSG